MLTTTEAPTRAVRLTLTLADARADDARRTVTVTGTRVLIDRRFRGFAMRVAVPMDHYTGVALVEGAGGEGSLCLAHRDPELCVPLGRADAADWRGWARCFGLPTVVERGPGDYVAADARAPIARRRGRATVGRRPKFLGRRRVGVASGRVFSGEREIIARD